MGSRFLRILVLAALCLAGLVWLRGRLKQVLDGYFRGDTLMTPDIRGLHIDDATRELKGSLELEIARSTYDPKRPRGTILSQQPTPGIRVRRGKTLFLRVSKGADLQPVPAVTGLALRKASIALRNVGLQLGDVCLLRSTEAVGGTVLEQTPPPGDSLGRGGRVDLLVATAAEPGRGSLPRVIGISAKRGQEILKRVGVARIHRIETVRPGQPRGYVVSQNPPPGTFFEDDTVVTIGVSVRRGPPRKLLELGYQIPPGLSERTLLVAVTDDGGRKVAHRARHLPGEAVRLEAEGSGAVRVEYYLDDFLVAEESY